MSLVKWIIFGIAFSAVSPTIAQDLKPTPTSAIETLLVRVYLIAGEDIDVIVAEVDADAFRRLEVKDQPNLAASMYRLTSDHKTCEAFAAIGEATKISDTQLAIRLADESKSKARTFTQLATNPDATKRQAFMLLPRTSGKKFNFAGKSIDEFSSEVQPKLNAGGLIAYPVTLGRQALAVTCTCKSFFGCTSGCCTSPACNVRLGICQANPNCKKVDVASNCGCRE